MAKKLWGGRFKKKINSDFFKFQKSIQYDYRLAKYDIYHSLIHILVLRHAKILSSQETQRLTGALKEILHQIESNSFRPSLSAEDIHTEIQNRVEKKLGKLGLKLHTLRSRNDQIAFDEKYYCDIESEGVGNFIQKVISSLGCLSKHYNNIYIVGYTHTQRAQKVLFKDYIQAFIHMFERDRKRLLDFSRDLVVYIGAGAFRGTSLTKNYDEAIKEYLKESQGVHIATVENSLDHVSDRDFLIEFLGILSILQMHLSRLAEDFILYSTKEFNFISLPEEFCTGSSLMPQKKNPDFLELVRGYTGKIYGNLVSLLTAMKGLPLTYNRDMQLDKEPLFSSVDIIKDELKILAKFIKGIRLNKLTISKALEDEQLYATGLAGYLVNKGLAFKDAHEIVGRLIRQAEDSDCKIKNMDDSSLKKFSPYLNKAVINKILR